MNSRIGCDELPARHLRPALAGQRRPATHLPRPPGHCLAQATIYLSVLAAAELSIKVGKGRIKLTQPVQRWVEDAVRLHHLTLLPVELGPAAAGLLPWIHSDPFDRLLIATARHHSLEIITSDETIPKYPGVKTVW